MSGFGMLRVDTPLGAINFPTWPGVKARGSAAVDPDGAVRIHVIVKPHGSDPRQHLVYSVSRKADLVSAGSLGLLDIKLLRDDGAFEL